MNYDRFIIDCGGQNACCDPPATFRIDWGWRPARPLGLRAAFLVDSGPDALRPGDLARIQGVVMLAAEGMPFRAHYQASYSDGLTVLVPVDSPTVRLTVAVPERHGAPVSPAEAVVDLEGLDDQDPAERALAVMLEGLDDGG